MNTEGLTTPWESKAVGRSLTQRSGPANDNVQTPQALANLIVNHFKPSGRCLDPCCGLETHPFANAMIDLPSASSVTAWDIRHKRSVDFLSVNWMEEEGEEDWSWLITNPPWSQLREFRLHAMEVADNVVFLCSAPTWFYTATQKDMEKAGFGLVELLYVPTPPKPWPQSGFALAAGWIRRGWTGAIHNNRSLLNS